MVTVLVFSIMGVFTVLVSRSVTRAPTGDAPNGDFVNPQPTSKPMPQIGNFTDVAAFTVSIWPIFFILFTMILVLTVMKRIIED